MWYSWPDLPSFDTWHTTVCTDLGIPHPGINADTGEIDESAQWTTAYTAAVDCGTDWRAVVEPAIAAQYPDGLGTPCDPPPSPDIDI